MVLDHVWQAVPNLEQAIRKQMLVDNRDSLWIVLRQLLEAHAPSTGVTLPGAIFDQVSDIAAMFGLADRLDPNIGGAGIPGLWLGVAKEQVDLVVVARLDRLTLRIQQFLEPSTAVVVPACGFDLQGYDAQYPAKAVRFDPESGKLGVSARGKLSHGQNGLCFEAEQGALDWQDVILLEPLSRRQGDWVRGAGLDNAAGVLCALGTAAIIRRIEEHLLEFDQRCLFIFPDHRDHLMRTLVNLNQQTPLAPLIGTVFVEGQYAQEALGGVRYEAGAAYAFGSSRGLFIPMNYQQLTRDLAAAFGRLNPSTAQYNPAGQSQAFPGAEACSHRVLGLMGPPLGEQHVGLEVANLKDMQACVWWLSAYLAVVLNLVPSLTARYVLG
jgi:hypothetical protein